eukprot:TRINITY_DN8369_c0_g1_i6.p1 TRINITY_DN8369_c0_g1~~TRINITY_DN8369_c0_g1_i6.p1  ORF type:complete len:126 (-),score=40.32 TRINITY_DN8369_c0_g1_i6:156-488(-)
MCIRDSYIIGSGSPIKEKQFKPISKPNQDYEDEAYNQEELSYGGKEQYENEQEVDPIEYDDKYRNAILQQKFWGSEQTTSEYRESEGRYQAPGSTKPELDIVGRYRAKYP